MTSKTSFLDKYVLEILVLGSILLATLVMLFMPELIGQNIYNTTNITIDNSLNITIQVNTSYINK